MCSIQRRGHPEWHMSILLDGLNRVQYLLLGIYAPQFQSRLTIKFVDWTLLGWWGINFSSACACRGKYITLMRVQEFRDKDSTITSEKSSFLMKPSIWRARSNLWSAGVTSRPRMQASYFGTLDSPTSIRTAYIGNNIPWILITRSTSTYVYSTTCMDLIWIINISFSIKINKLDKKKNIL